MLSKIPFWRANHSACFKTRNFGARVAKSIGMLQAYEKIRNKISANEGFNKKKTLNYLSAYRIILKLFTSNLRRLIQMIENATEINF